MKKLSVILIALMIPFYSCGQKEAVSLPTVTLIGPLEVFFDLNASYVEFGYKAYDFAGNDISDLVIRDTSSLNMAEAGTYRVSYTAVDRLGNKSTPIYRTVRVGSGQSPVITVSGENPLLLSLNAEFSVPTATAVGSDGKTDLSDSVTVNAESVNTSVPGTYSVYYTVTDVSGIVGMTELTVYVLESDTPRIVVSGKGTSADDPLVIEQLVIQDTTPTDDDLNNAREALTKALPTIKAYDLEDGDISYRVSIVEDDIYNQILNAICLGGSVTDPLTLTVSDEDGHSPSVSIYVTVAEDMTPPVIYIDNEKPVYEIEIDMWTDQWNTEWVSGILTGLTIFVTDDNGTTVEAFDKNGTAESPGATDQSKIQCWIEYPDVINSSTQEVYPDSDLETTLKHSKGANTNCYYYQTPNHEINTKTVLLKAQDAAGIIGEKSIKVFLRDTTDPEIVTTKATVNFGATQYSFQVKDNSGYEKTTMGNIPGYQGYPSMGLIEGTFTDGVSFFDTDYNRNSINKTGTLVVQAPSTGNVFSYGHFTGSDQSGANEIDMYGFTPTGWGLTSFTGGSFSNLGANFYNMGNWLGTGAGVKQLNRIIETYDGFVMCGGVRKNGVTAYLTSGFRRDSISNVNLGILSNTQNSVLYESVTYSLSYMYKDFIVNEGDYRPGSRILTIRRESGEGVMNDNSTEFKIERSPSKPSNTQYAYNAIVDTFQSESQNFTVKNGNINSFSILYSVGKADSSDDISYPDVGSFISEIRVKAVNWNKLQPNGSVAPANPSGS